MVTDRAGLEVLDEEECLGLLAGASLGRVGLTIGGIPAIFPVNYCWHDGQVAFCTDPGTKLRRATEHEVVAFEVDQIEPMLRSAWSVLVVGPAREVVDPVVVRLIREQRVRPWAPGPRDHVVTIYPAFVSGGRITHMSGA